ncbi:hypothetical protein JCM3774_000112 [Rhodotorula dairenensis]
MVLQTRKSIACAAALVAACALPTASAFQYTVGVGKDQTTGQPGLGFDPSRTVVTDVTTSNTVVFTFLEGIHRVVQTDGSLNAPCAPSGGFDTGVQTVPAGTNGPSFTFDISNNTETYYFADIANDYSPCFLGAVFCLNTNESSSTTSCHAVQAAAISLGKDQGVTTTPGLSTSTSASATSSGSTTSSSVSSTSSSATSTTSSLTSSSASPASSTVAATGSAANAAASGGSSGAGSLSVANGVTSAMGVVAAGLAVLVAAV